MRDILSLVLTDVGEDVTDLRYRHFFVYLVDHHSFQAVDPPVVELTCVSRQAAVSEMARRLRRLLHEA